MKKVLSTAVITVLIGAFLAAAQAPPANSPVARHGQLRVEGDRIVGAHGNPVQLRGMSLFWSHSTNARDFYSAPVVSHLASDWRTDVVRAAFAVNRSWTDASAFLNTSGNIQDNGANRARMETVVSAARTAGIYVIIDWHAYVTETPAFFQHGVNFFKEMANQYRGVPNVIFEIYNEPNGCRSGNNCSAPPPSGGGLPDNGSTPWATIRNYMQTVTDTIRAQNNNNLILIGTPNWCQNPETATANPVNGTNLAYTIHFYSGDNTVQHRGALRNRALVSMDRGYAMFASEFGLSNAGGGGGIANTAEADKWFDFLSYFNIGWANWSLSSQNESSAALTTQSRADNISGWNLTASGTHVRNRLRAGEAQSATMPGLRLLTINIDGWAEDAAHMITFGTVTDVGTTGNANTFSPPMAASKVNRRVFDPNANVELAAWPADASRWRFVRWEGNTAGAIPGATPERITVNMNANRNITAVFESVSTSILSDAATHPVRWSILRSGGSLALSGPSSAVASLYDMRGKRVGQFTYDGSGRAMNIGANNMPAGSYIVVVRDLATNREVFRDRVNMVR